MRILSVLLGAAILGAGVQGSFAQTGSHSEVMTKITPEAMAAVLRDAGYRAEIQQGKSTKYIRTAMAGYKVAVYFYDCEEDGCGAMQLSTGFDKSPRLTATLANKWNSEHRYARAYVDPSDGSFYFEYDFVATGITNAFIKDNLTLYEQQLGNLGKLEKAAE